MIVIGMIAALAQGFLYGVCALFALRVIAGQGTWDHRAGLAFLLCAAAMAGCGYLVQETRRELDHMMRGCGPIAKSLAGYDRTQTAPIARPEGVWENDRRIPPVA